MGFSWSLFLAHRCDEEKACFARKSTPQLIHGRGPPLVFVAGEQGLSGWLPTRPKSMWAEGVPRDRTGRTRTLRTGDFQAILDDAERVDGTAALRTMYRPSTGMCHRPLHLSGTRGTLCTFHICYCYVQCHYLQNGQIWNEVPAELPCFRGLLLVLSSS